MTHLDKIANEYAQTLYPIDIDEVSVIVRDFCAGYKAAETDAEERHAKELQQLKDKAVEVYKAVCRTLFSGCDLEHCNSSKCNGLLLFTAKLNEK